VRRPHRRIRPPPSTGFAETGPRKRWARIGARDRSKASKIPITVIEYTIRTLTLPFDFDDITVCAVSGVWFGLELVVREELR